MNKINGTVILLAVWLAAGCATTSKTTAKPVIWETATIAKANEAIGPVSVREEISESAGDMIGGLADYVSKDGRVSDYIPADTKAALETKRLKYKEMIFDKLSLKAKEYGADAVIGASYRYVPGYVALQSKSIVTAEGTMVKYK